MRTGRSPTRRTSRRSRSPSRRSRSCPHINSIVSPFSQDGQAQISKDKHTAFITVLLNISNEEVTEGLAQRFLDAAEPGRKAGMKVAASGQIGSELSEPETHSSDVIGLFAAMVILAFTFGTLVAMGMAIVPACLGLLVGLSLIGLLGHVTEVPSIAPTLATMIGLGVGIDYALFLVSRYRVHRAEGMGTEDAIAKSVGTTGTAIVFAGTTVVIALVTLLVAGIPLVTSLGYASAVAVVTAVLAAITLLPALLALVGSRIDSLRAARVHAPEAEEGGQGVLGQMGGLCHRPPGPFRGAHARGADRADDPVLLPPARPGGHRRNPQGHDRAPGLRLPLGGLRAGLHGAADRGGGPGRRARRAERGVREAVLQGAEPAERAGERAGPGRDRRGVPAELGRRAGGPGGHAAGREGDSGDQGRGPEDREGPAAEERRQAAEATGHPQAARAAREPGRRAREAGREARRPDGADPGQDPGDPEGRAVHHQSGGPGRGFRRARPSSRRSSTRSRTSRRS